MHFITENIDDVPFCIAKWPCENAFWHQAIIAADQNGSEIKVKEYLFACY